MATHDPTTEEPAPDAVTSATRLFAVRVWKEPLSGGDEYRGSVRDLATDAFRGFRDWRDLVAFMVARIEQAEAARHDRGKGI